MQFNGLAIASLPSDTTAARILQQYNSKMKQHEEIPGNNQVYDG